MNEELRRCYFTAAVWKQKSFQVLHVVANDESHMSCDVAQASLGSFRNEFTMENTLHSSTIQDGFLQHLKMPYGFVDKLILV